MNGVRVTISIAVSLTTVDWYISNQKWCQRASATYRQERLGVLAPTEAA